MIQLGDRVTIMDGLTPTGPGTVVYMRDPKIRSRVGVCWDNNPADLTLYYRENLLTVLKPTAKQMS